GGITNPVPIAPTASARADLTIAVSLGGEPRGTGGAAGGAAPVQETAEPRPIEEWADRFRAGAAQLLERDAVRSLLGRFAGGADAPAGTLADAPPGAVPVAEP